RLYHLRTRRRFLVRVSCHQHYFRPSAPRVRQPNGARSFGDQMFAMTPIPGPRYVGVGFSKTGTSTLGACFGLLGLGPVGSPDAIHDIFRQSVPSASDNSRAARFAEYPWRLMVDDLCQYDSYGVALFIAAGFRSLHDRPWSMKDCFKVLDSAYPG